MYPTAVAITPGSRRNSASTPQKQPAPNVAFFIGSRGLLNDLDAFPEGDATGNLLRGCRWRRVVPGRIRIHCVANNEVVVVSFALPVAGGMGGALAQVFRFDRGAREVVVTLDD